MARADRGGLVTGQVRVQVPASSANLGPGYDALGIALALRDELTVEVTDEVTGGGSGGLVLECAGEGADTVPCDASHLVYRSMLSGFAAMGIDAPGVRLSCLNAIPHGRGLGSSSAAIVGGLAAARALVEDGQDRLGDEQLFRLAAQLEGHPDNVAPAVHGGFTIAYADVGGRFQAVRLDVDPGIAFVVYVPPRVLETRVARGLLPGQVPHDDAAHSAGRAALLVAALTGRPDQLWAATEDRLHQQYRAPAMEDSVSLVAALRSAGLPAVVSGAGPTVLALVAPEEVAAACAFGPEGWRVLPLAVDTSGVRTL